MPHLTIELVRTYHSKGSHAACDVVFGWRPLGLVLRGARGVLPTFDTVGTKAESTGFHAPFRFYTRQNLCERKIRAGISLREAKMKMMARGPRSVGAAVRTARRDDPTAGAYLGRHATHSM